MLPLTTIVRPLGAIGFGSRRPIPFDDEELDFLGLVARQVAVAVDNVLHDESDRSAQFDLSQERDRLRLLLEVSESIASIATCTSSSRSSRSGCRAWCRSTTSTSSSTIPSRT